MPDEIANQITTLATSPLKASGDAGSVEMPKITDVIEADRYLAGKQAGSKARRGIRLTKLVPPGTTGSC